MPKNSTNSIAYRIAEKVADAVGFDADVRLNSERLNGRIAHRLRT